MQHSTITDEDGPAYKDLLFVGRHDGNLSVEVYGRDGEPFGPVEHVLPQTPHGLPPGLPPGARPDDAATSPPAGAHAQEPRSEPR